MVLASLSLNIIINDTHNVVAYFQLILSIGGMSAIFDDLIY
jgi:heme/copper-type cytochrome/quinol oxidase subunit 1